MKINISYLLGFVAAMYLLSVSACKTENLVPAQEPVKDVAGSWKILSASRNGVDISNLIDFSQFRITFSDGKYTLLNKLPFIVTQDGSYSLNDPKFPFQISFTTAAGQSTATQFTYPTVNGVRQLSLQFSPGCPENSYIYVLQKSN